MIPIKCAELFCHTENSARADLQGCAVNDAKGSEDALIGCCGFLDLKGTELAVAFHDNVDLLGVLITIEIEIRLKSRILIALHNLGYGKVLKKRAAHSTAFGDLGA